jgi:hypothetical protein
MQTLGAKTVDSNVDVAILALFPYLYVALLAPDQQLPLIGSPWISNSSATVGFDWSFEGSQAICRTSATQASPDLGK